MENVFLSTTLKTLRLSACSLINVSFKIMQTCAQIFVCDAIVKIIHIQCKDGETQKTYDLLDSAVWCYINHSIDGYGNGHSLQSYVCFCMCVMITKIRLTMLNAFHWVLCCSPAKVVILDWIFKV